MRTLSALEVNGAFAGGDEIPHVLFQVGRRRNPAACPKHGGLVVLAIPLPQLALVDKG